MILKPVLQECIEILLMKQSEESLECLCLLIKTVGKELENYGNDSEKKEVLIILFCEVHILISNWGLVNIEFVLNFICLYYR